MGRYPFSETITVVRPGGTDRWGDTTPGAEHTIADVVRYPATASRSVENTDYQDTTVTGYNLLLPAGADLHSADRVRLPGDPAPQPGQDPWQAARWAVVGEVTDYTYPFTQWNPGGIAAIERVS